MLCATEVKPALAFMILTVNSGERAHLCGSNCLLTVRAIEPVTHVITSLVAVTKYLRKTEVGRFILARTYRGFGLQFWVCGIWACDEALHGRQNPLDSWPENKMKFEGT